MIAERPYPRPGAKLSPGLNIVLNVRRQEMPDHPDPELRWRNRRRMAWVCLCAACLYPGLLLITDSAELGNIAWPFYTFAGAVVGAYVGFSTLDDKWRKQ